MIKNESERVMNKLIKSVSYLVFVAMVGFHQNVVAQSEDFDTWKQQFAQRALKEGIKQTTLDKYLPKMELLPQVVAQDIKQPEYLRNFWDYSAPRLNAEKIAKAQKIRKKYKTWLSIVSQKYQVPEQYLLALWSMETNFGSFMGKTPLLKSLSSLAYHPRRREFFTKELLAYFKILETEPYPPMLGSWDGGIGNFQFMPTTYLAYGVDADSNGTKSLTGSIPDSLASAANYLHKMGWKVDEPWGRPVVLPTDFDWQNAGQTKTVRNWKEMGLVSFPSEEIPVVEEEIMATLHTPMGSQGPAFLTYSNFKLINKWNRLELYALTTGVLADLISKQSATFNTPSDFRPLKTQEFLLLQETLQNMGYYAGEIDGKLGPKMRQALRLFQQNNNLKSDGYPNKETLIKLNIYQKELN